MQILLALLYTTHLVFLSVFLLISFKYSIVFGSTAVPYYTVVNLKTSWSWLVGLLRAHIVVKLFGSNGESNFVELKRYLKMK